MKGLNGFKNLKFKSSSHSEIEDGSNKLSVKNLHDKIPFTLERLLGCEVEFISPFGLTVNGYISKVRNSGLVNVTSGMFNVVVCAKDLTFFTEDGDELTFDEYVAMYYGE